MAKRPVAESKKKENQRPKQVSTFYKGTTEDVDVVNNRFT